MNTTKNMAVGAVVGVITGFGIAHIVGMAQAAATIEAYEQGKKAALSTRPVSVELEMTCANIWSNRVQPPEVFRK